KENSNLQIENATFKNASTGPSSTAKSLGWIQHKSLTEHSNEIINAAKQIVYFADFWFPKDALMQSCPPVLSDDVSSHYAMEDAYLRYSTYILYERLPPRLHGYAENMPAFKKSVHIICF
ncbi:hypothetical protein H0H87_012577, partial [Tephrocybe sp. NHM501043]